MLEILSDDEMYKIAKSCDNSHDGQFFMGVKTTMIYCLPSCKAKMPKRENVEFYLSKEEAVSNGMRGCRRCYSENFPLTKPQWFIKLVQHIENHLDHKVRLSELLQITKVDETTVRRYFKEYYNMTPIQFQRLALMNYAEELLIDGEEIGNVAFKIGFKSLSGFRSCFQKHMGYLPGKIIR